MIGRLRASPFNITIIRVYARTSSYNDSVVDEFYRELQSLIDQTSTQDILVVQGDWNAKVGDDSQEDWGEVCGRRKRKPWVTPEVIDHCDQRRNQKKKRGEPERAKDYREVKRKIRTEMKMAKETWIQDQGQEVEACLSKNNSKKAYQLVKDLTTEKQGKTTTIQNKSGKYLTEENEILNRWTEYCSDIYSYKTEGDRIVLDCPQIPDAEHHPILREEVESKKINNDQELIQSDPTSCP